MALSQVDICNEALIKIGQDIPIASLAEATKTGRVFSRCWQKVVDLVMAEHPWPFANKAVALSVSPDAAFPGWAYRYDVPSDCLTMLAVCPATGVRASMATLYADNTYPTGSMADARVEYDVVYGSQTTNIVTDLVAAYLLYSVRLPDTGRFPPLFAEALSCRLAMEIAPSLAGELGIKLSQKLQQDYEFARSKAIAHAFNESRETLIPLTPSVAARGGY